jgi:hypothetical protein
MARKVYESVTGTLFTFPVTVSDVKHWIDCNPKYVTSVSGIQSAIEATAYFTSGQIVTSGNYTDQVKALVTTDVKSGIILTSEINAAGTGYVAGDIITMTNSGGEKAIVRVLTVVAVTGAVATYEVVDGGTGYVADASPLQESTSSTAGDNFEINILTVTGATEFPEVGPFKLTSFADVTTVNQAKEILRAEPYNVHHMKLRTPDAIMAQAIEHSVTFPNWVI